MRIVHDTPELLIVAERADGMRVCGGVLALFGAGLVATGFRIDSTAAQIVGGFVGVLGLAFLLLPSISTFYFNRGEKRLIIARRRVWERQTERYDEHPLANVSAVMAEESREAGKGASTWRVVVRLNDGRSIPFTPYYTTGYPAKAAMAGRIASFLGVETNALTAGGPKSPFAMVPGSRPAAIGIAFVFVIFGLVFGSIGGIALTREYHRLATWQPVQARVLEKRVDAHVDSDGNTYRPAVTYRYEVNGRTYTSTRTLPINESRSGRWAYRIIERFAIGGTYTAWYDPTDPANAFLVRSHSLIAPIFAAIGLVVTLGGCAAMVGVVRRGA
jgi:hypothetical protein